ncbi:MAG: hypothetical protein ACYCYE_07080 [Clostridia bacterium]
MAKDEFLRYFQMNLCNYIRELIVDEWGYDDIIVGCEDGRLIGRFNGYMDISIKNKNTDDVIVAIEIEHLSGFNQAKINVEKLKTWIHNSTYRNCALLHVFNEECNIWHDDIEKLIRYARNNQLKGLGFFYDFIFYKVEDKRKVDETALNIVNSKEFQARIWMLIEDVGLF